MATGKTSRANIITSLLVFVGVFIVYFITLSPSVYLGRTGEGLRAVTTATNTSFIKSVEYPVWHFLGRLFMSVSSNKAWALNLFSAICGAASIALLFRIFASFSHTRMRDELVRFRGLPHLARFAAVAAVLLVAFTQTFWLSSITAGTNALNALFVVLVTFLLLRYKETRKKRYFMFYGIVYAIGLANCPTLLLLLPIYVVLSILWCREVYTDWITLGITFLLAAVLFGVAAFSAPARFASQLPAYFIKPMPITRPMFDYVKWYWAQIRPVLPVGGLMGVLVWVLWLILPTLPPVIYLTFSKAQRHSGMGRGSAITDGIFRVLAFLYTLFGLFVLFDFVIGPYPFTGQVGFVVAYAVVGAWVCYMLGYWTLMFTSKPSATVGPGGARYSQAAYRVLIAACLLLPAGSFAKHLVVDQTSLAGFTLAEDFAKDTLRSAASAADSEGGDRVVLVVTDSWGELLNYVKKHRVPSEIADRVTIVDLYAAAVAADVYVDEQAYLSDVLVGQPLPPANDPAANPNLSDAEKLLAYVRAGSGARNDPQPPLCLTGDAYRYDWQNAGMTLPYEHMPLGLVYLLASRTDFETTPADRVADGLALWAELGTAHIEPKPLDERPWGTAAMVNRAAKLANDFGIYCHKYGTEEQAVSFYNLALRYDPFSYAALKNLKSTGGPVDFDLDGRLSAANELFEGQTIRDVRTILGPGASKEQQEIIRTFRSAAGLMQRHGLVRDVALVKDLFDSNPDPRARGSREFICVLADLRVLVNPKDDGDLAERGSAYLSLALQPLRQGGRPSAQLLVRAIKDLEAAMPSTETDKDRGRVRHLIGGAYAQLNNYTRAEAALKEAIELDPTLTSAFNDLAQVYARTERVNEAIELLKTYLTQHPPTTRGELIAALRRLIGYSALADDPDGFKAFAEEYARANPEHAVDTKFFLADVAASREEYEEATKILDEVRRAYNDPPAGRVRLAVLLHRQKRYDEVLALEELPIGDVVEMPERIQWHLVRGEAQMLTGNPSGALNEGKKAADFARSLYQKSGDPAQLSTVMNSLGLSWAAAMQVIEESDDPDVQKEAMGYAGAYYGLANQLYRMNQVSEQAVMVAGAYYGWTRFRIEHDLKMARALIEPVLYVAPNSGRMKYYLGAVLIEQGEVARGVGLLREALGTELNRYEEVQVKALLDKYGEAVPEEATTPTGETPPEAEAVSPADTSTEPEAEQPETGTAPETPADE